MTATLDMSRKTAGYSSSSTPLGPKDLWKTEGLELPHYIRNVARGIMRQGKTKSRAIQLAVAAVKRWARGGGDVSPEVRAAAAKAVAQWEAAKAKARATPNKSDHSNTYDQGGVLPAGSREVINDTGKPMKMWTSVDLARVPAGNDRAGQFMAHLNADYPSEPRSSEVPTVTADNLPQLEALLAGIDGQQLGQEQRDRLAKDLVLAASRVMNVVELASEPATSTMSPLVEKIYKRLRARGIPEERARLLAEKAAKNAKATRTLANTLEGEHAAQSALLAARDDAARALASSAVELASTPPRLRQASRKNAASEGAALPDGSFPMRSRRELADAIRAWGRAVAAGKAKQVKALMLKQARKLGVGQSVIDRIKALKG